MQLINFLTMDLVDRDLVVEEEEQLKNEIIIKLCVFLQEQKD